MWVVQVGIKYTRAGDVRTVIIENVRTIYRWKFVMVASRIDDIGAILKVKSSLVYDVILRSRTSLISESAPSASFSLVEFVWAHPWTLQPWNPTNQCQKGKARKLSMLTILWVAGSPLAYFHLNATPASAAPILIRSATDARTQILLQTRNWSKSVSHKLVRISRSISLPLCHVHWLTSYALWRVPYSWRTVIKTTSVHDRLRAWYCQWDMVSRDGTCLVAG